jgi:hypothetical protein
MSEHTEIYKQLNAINLEQAKMNKHLETLIPFLATKQYVGDEIEKCKESAGVNKKAIVSIIGAVGLAITGLAVSVLNWFSSLPKV